jgi:hypothetical protein
MYYQLESDEGGMTAYVKRVHATSYPLIQGVPIDATKEVLPFRYRYRDPYGKPLFDYYSANKLMSRAAGVDNLQKFETEMEDETTGKVSADFWTVNIIGLVECANLEASKTSELGSSFYFHDLVISPEKAGDLLMFRLAESMINVLVHEKVAHAIQAGAFRGVVLTPLSTTPPEEEDDDEEEDEDDEEDQEEEN